MIHRLVTGRRAVDGFISAGAPQRFLLLSSKEPKKLGVVFVTTKLREKFVARIPAAGARSHAKGERKRRGKRKRARTNKTRRKVCPRISRTFAVQNYELLDIITRELTDSSTVCPVYETHMTRFMLGDEASLPRRSDDTSFVAAKKTALS